MAYANVADIQSLLMYLPAFGPATVPTTTQAQGFIDQCSAEIDSALGMHGIQVPVTTPAWFVADLQNLNKQGAAGLILEAIAFQTQPSTDNTSPANVFLKRYDARLKELRAAIGIASAVGIAEYDRAPRSFFLDVGAIGPESNGATDAWGEEVDSEPAFEREAKF